MEMLSEHLCQGWLEGYLLTGRHGLFSCYEAFIHIVDSMFNQHAKWLKVTREHPLAAADRVAELPADLARLAAGPQRLQPPGPGLHRPRGQQEGRGRARLPAARRQHAAVAWPTTACAPATTSTSSSPASSPQPQWLDMDGAIAHCTERPRHLGLGGQRRRRRARRRDGVRRRRAHAGDAGRRRPAAQHPAGPEDPRGQRGRPDALAARARASARTARRRVRRALHARQAGDFRLPRLSVAHPPADLPAANHDNIHVRGYKEEGTTTTPFDMVVLNELDRYHLAIDVIDRVPGLAVRPPGCASRWSMPGSPPTTTPASTARTQRKSATGHGRPAVDAPGEPGSRGRTRKYKGRNGRSRAPRRARLAGWSPRVVLTDKGATRGS